MLSKQSIAAGRNSEVKEGEGLQGILASSIEIGQPILLKNGSKTSEVRGIEAGPDSLRITTETSVYELHKLFSGLAIDSQLGRVALPEDAQPAQLKPGSAPGIKARNGEKIIEVKIDRDALKDVLIQTGGGAVHVVDDRYVVLARVGGAHVPFYRSSSGTDGKKQGEWYPFFGHTGAWIMKGDIASDGSMNYLPEITEVQKVLNEHLVLPDTGYLDKDFNMVSPKDGAVIYSVGEDISIDSFRSSSEFKNRNGSLEEAEKQYVNKLTGYDSTQLNGYHPAGSKNSAKAQMAQVWMTQILQGIHKAQNP